MGEGVVYETMNIAALWELPVLFVVDNNQYAQSTPVAQAQAGDLATRATSFGIRSGVVPAAAYDPFSVFAAAQEAVAYVRTASAPYYLLLNSYRLAPHSKGDDYRDPAEIEQHRQQDPLLRLGATLPPQRRAAIDTAIAHRLAESLAQVFADNDEKGGTA